MLLYFPNEENNKHNSPAAPQQIAIIALDELQHVSDTPLFSVEPLPVCSKGLSFSLLGEENLNESHM